MSQEIKFEYILDGSAIFNDAFNVLNNELNNRVKISEKDSTYRGTAIMIPAVVVLGITIELGFKALIFKDKATLTKTHNLKNLFSELNNTYQDKIIKSTCDRNKITEEKFYEKIAKYSIAFVEWRYFFEKSNEVDYAFLRALNIAVQEEIRNESLLLG